MKRTVLTYILLLAVSLAALITSPRASAETLTGLAKVIDGDSLEIGTQRIRLLGIDAPEGTQWCHDNRSVEYRCGVMSSAWLITATTGHRVRCEWSEKDKYNRLLSTCYVGERNINAGSVEAGWSVAYRKYSAAYVDQEQLARGEKRGLWSGSFQMPWDWRSARKSTATLQYKNPSPDVASRCCKICRKGKACGDSCIRRTYTCRKPPGCACDAQ